MTYTMINDALHEQGFRNLSVRVDSTEWEDRSISTEVLIHQRRESGDRVEYEYVWSGRWHAPVTTSSVVEEFIGSLTLTRAQRPWLDL
jgi:hypothetical protein